MLASYTPGLIHFKTFGILSSWGINAEPCILIKFFKKEAHAQSQCNKPLVVDVLYDSYLISGIQTSGVSPRLGQKVSEGFIVPGWRIMFFGYFLWVANELNCHKF